MQIKITITDEEYALLKEQATRHLNSLSKEARLLLRSQLLTPATPTPEIKSEPAAVAPPKSKPAISKPSVEEFVEFLDKEGIPEDDTSWELYEGIKKQVPQFKKLELVTFDEAQILRREKKRSL